MKDFKLLTPCPRLWPVIVVSVFLAACGGAGDGIDPAVEDFPIAYVKRSIVVDEESGAPVVEDVRDLTDFNAGADLYLRERASPSARETNLTSLLTGGLGDVKDVSVSFDGEKILFALRLPEIEDADPEDQPTWNIWEYDIPGKQLRRVIESDIVAEEGEDVSPHYLTDGRIVFVSTRQRKSQEILLQEGKPQFKAQNEDRNDIAMQLHVMNADGTEIEQLTFNQSLDFDPTVLSSGEIVFSRWDNAANRNAISLYKINPDGTGLQAYYGVHSHDSAAGAGTYQYVDAQEFPDGRLLVVVRPQRSQLGDKFVFIDAANFADENVPLNGAGGSPLEDVTAYEINVEDGLSSGGRLSAVYPLWDGTSRALISWSSCQLDQNGQVVPCSSVDLSQPDLVEALPAYGLYIYDFDNDTQLPLVLPQQGVVFSDVVAARPRDYQFYPVADPNADLQNEAVGLIHIRSVYDLDGQADFDLNGVADDPLNPVTLGGTTIASLADLADPAKVAAGDRPARFLRIVKGVGIPDDEIKEVNGEDFGASRNQLMREIIGYAMIEPDGSVMAKVPADVPLMISVVDGSGRRIGDRHNNWLQLRPGEVVECHGCHDHDSGQPHGRRGALTALNSGAPTSGQPFANTNPLWSAELGETMAQTRLRNSCGEQWSQSACAMLTPDEDLTFEDLWADETVVAKADPFSYAYADLTTTPPVTADCALSWSADCRLVINYPDHIFPLWSVSRPIPDGLGGTRQGSCIECHAPTDGVEAQLPAGQLDLTESLPDGINDVRRASYDELFDGGDEQELVNGELVTRLIDVEVPRVDENGDPVYEVDANGDLVLDGEGNPIQIIDIIPQPVPVPPSMSVNSARASYFMEKMTGQELRAGRSLADDPNTVDHSGMLSAAELKLISEWLDIGGQYYNDPFAIPDAAN